MYEYRAYVVKVVDGDTVWLDVDLGFDVKRRDSFRLYGINTPEMNTPEGVVAKARLAEMLGWDAQTGADPITVTTQKDRREKYGRYLATLWVAGVNLNQQLVAEGLAQEYKV